MWFSRFPLSSTVRKLYSFWSFSHYPHSCRWLLRKRVWALGQTPYYYRAAKKSRKSRLEVSQLAFNKAESPSLVFHMAWAFFWTTITDRKEGQETRQRKGGVWRGCGWQHSCVCVFVYVVIALQLLWPRLNYISSRELLLCWARSQDDTRTEHTDTRTQASTQWPKTACKSDLWFSQSTKYMMRKTMQTFMRPHISGTKSRVYHPYSVCFSSPNRYWLYYVIYSVFLHVFVYPVALSALFHVGDPLHSSLQKKEMLENVLQTSPAHTRTYFL